MKSSKAQTHRHFYRLPTLDFRSATLTSYAGLIVFWQLFLRLELLKRLKRCVVHQTSRSIFGLAKMLMLLIVHILLGFRRAEHISLYQHDPLVIRVLGVRKLPHQSTLTRALKQIDDQSLNRLAELQRELIFERLKKEKLTKITVDFDGSVISTRRHAEGAKVGFNKKRKGDRSYYPLYATIAQTGQFFDMLHRSGNKHDSNGCDPFMLACFRHLRRSCPASQLEMRTDSAFFCGKRFRLWEVKNIEYTCSTPFDRFPDLKTLIANCDQWESVLPGIEAFEIQWKAGVWEEERRLIGVRQPLEKKVKGPIQLDLFRPTEREWRYQMILTNKRDTLAEVIAFHHGRGTQEKLFAEAKQSASLDVVMSDTLNANRVWTRASMLAHNIARELEMEASTPKREVGSKREPLWHFLSLGRLQQLLLHRAGRMSRPQGSLKMTMNENNKVKSLMSYYMPE